MGKAPLTPPFFRDPLTRTPLDQIGSFVVSALWSREATLEDSSEWIMFMLVVLWTTRLFSALLAYWGARKTASAVLNAFGSFWAVFVL